MNEATSKGTRRNTPGFGPLVAFCAILALPGTVATAVQTAVPSVTAPSESPLAAGGHAHLRDGAALRARSLPDEDPEEGVGPNSLLTLKVVLKKDTGAWWYVTSPEGSGWVLDSDLVPASE